MSRAIDLAVARLISASDNRQPCKPVRDLLGEADIDAAYAVQSQIAEHRLMAGQQVVGRKVGLTSAAVQRQFGVYQPDFGLLFDDMLFASGEPLPITTFLQPRLEAEVAFVLGASLDNPRASVADVLRATEFVLPAIEIVDSRIDGWDIRITDTVADNASSGAVVLGTTPYSLHGLVLADVGVVIDHRDEPVSVGAGSACMGSPAVAVTWLAREAARRGRPLAAGDVVLSGALGPMVSVDGVGRYRARLDGLNEVEAIFDEAGVRA